MSAPPDRPRILVIRLGALGDFVLSLGPMAAIRRHHAGAHITLLTTAPFVDLARASGYFDDVWLDTRPKFWQVGGWRALRRRLRGANFARVYDLQTSDRSGFYFRLLGKGVEWSGIAPGCSHPDANPERTNIHTIERQREQLRLAGIDTVPLSDLSFLQADVGRFGIATPYICVVPGGAAHRPEKRWPAERYVALAQRFLAVGLTPVILGGPDECDLAQTIVAQAPGVRDLTGQTDFADLATLARGARGAVGNDTGPMHVLALAGCASLVLFSAASNPVRTAPRGGRRPDGADARVQVLRADDLATLPLDTVWGELPFAVT